MGVKENFMKSLAHLASLSHCRIMLNGPVVFSEVRDATANSTNPACSLHRIQPTASCIVNPKKLETVLRTNSAGIPYSLLFRIEAIGFPTFGILLYLCTK